MFAKAACLLRSAIFRNKFMTAISDTLQRSYRTVNWGRGYSTLSEVHNYAIDEVEGSIPSELQGTLFRNGPGRFDRGGVSYQHPFDGDGMICAISFDQGKAHFKNRFVRTAEYLQEEKEDRILHKNVFATLKPGGFWNNAFDFSFKNVANTNVVYHGGKLWALWEAAPPYQLTPDTLETLGIDELGGILAKGLPFSAHPKLNPVTGELMNFGVRAGLQTTVRFYRVQPNGQVVVDGTHTFPGFAFVHDFVYTENYWIIFQNPMTLDPLPFVFGLKAAGECLKFADNQPTRILLIPRSGGEMITLEADPFFVFHHVNAFEEQGKVIVDSIRYEEYLTTQEGRDFRETDFSVLPTGKIWRFEIDPKARRLSSRVLVERSSEFPQVNPSVVGRPHRYAYVAAIDAPQGNAPLQAILKMDFQKEVQQVYSFAPDGFVSEPVFIPRPSSQKEDDGWLITLVYRAEEHRTEVVILDARDLDQGPIARLKLKHHVPFGLHGTFTPQVFAR